ncbi:homeobox protein knotted-1-like 6 [Olea europaea var. sylvestris]|uniref:homeobox protein knotted-1-like 6 n=1 Tax=Olea europaea var. sylvestris TaxID=158386 RepID=UPI000C1CCC60|nr:homeobox protein knotted-1-like 6 [Olea europaea var. sylvestris]XP_022878293.1 homeobox protein knotted-1-like 6 [Olea europaea var. sylvestris]
MDEMYGLHSMSDYSDKALMSPENLIIPAEYHNHYHALICSGDLHCYPISGSTEDINFPCSVATEVASINPQTEKGNPEDDHGHASSLIKAKIASHPSYTKLLNAYLDCQKVGAPPEIASLLEKIRRESEFCKEDELSVCLGVDPELDDFMETYYDILVKYKSDLSRPFDEATSFLNKIETQLGNLCKGASFQISFNPLPPPHCPKSWLKNIHIGDNPVVL